MEEINVLKTVVLNVEKGELVINDKLINDVYEFSLIFDSGEWELNVRQRKLFYTNGKAASRDTAKE